MVLNSLFPLGQIYATRGAIEAAEKAEDNLSRFLALHASGNWGELGEEDKLQNERAVRLRDSMILSVYRLKDNTKIWIITESDNSVTTILLPSEY